MTHVVTESCINCKHTDCVTVCPVDCFVEGPNFLAINPEECIDCGVCIPECPVDAIFAEGDIAQEEFDKWCFENQEEVKRRQLEFDRTKFQEDNKALIKFVNQKSDAVPWYKRKLKKFIP